MKVLNAVDPGVHAFLVLAGDAFLLVLACRPCQVEMSGFNPGGDPSVDAGW
jgi:hypothetical protein